MKRIAVAHLVRRQNGPAPLRSFLHSYQKWDAGIEHDLIIILKGFRDGSEREAYRELLGSLPHELVDVPDKDYDIASYGVVAERYDYRYFCLLNSFSAVLAPGWLEKLHRGVIGAGTGLAGATGSYQSLRPASFAAYLELSRRMRRQSAVKNLLMSLPFSHHLDFLRLRLRFGPDFPGFPNYHVRTNAFIVERDLLRRVVREPVLTKMDAYRFESGRRGLTAQVLEWGLEPVLVGSDGERYRKEDWHLSNTFWQSRQENLLIADNQTRRYSDGTPDVRDLLAYMAWGDLGRPS